MKDIDIPGVHVVENSPRFGHYEAKVTIGTETTTVAISAIAPESLREANFREQYFQATHAPFIAFRYGEQGQYSFQLNKDVVRVQQVSIKGPHPWYREDDRLYGGDQAYEGHLVQGRDTLEAGGVMIQSGEPFLVRLVPVPLQRK